ncbi:MAG: hypothetical protein ACHQ5A_10490, partial [Opitutales bacterium]
LLGLGALALVAQLSAEDSSSWGRAADNRIVAQDLTNTLMRDNPDLVVIGLHATAPGAKGPTMIASNLDRIGKVDDDDDIAVATERKTILSPNAKDPHKFEVQVPMWDASGKVIGACGFVFKYNAGDDEIELHRRALTLRAWLQTRITTLDALFKVKS